MKAAIEVTGLTYGYRPGANILDRVTLSIPYGDIVVLLGLNGAGKTTLLKTLLGVLPSPQNTIFVAGRDIHTYSAAQLSRMGAYVPQGLYSQCVEYDVRDYLVIGRTPHLGTFGVPSSDDYELADRYAEEMGIEELLHKRVSFLSGGQFRLVAIARALVQETEIIIMDEPFAELDIANQIRLMKSLIQLRENRKTILLTTHNPNHAFAINADTGVLQDGQIMCFGKAATVLDQERITRLYGDGVLLHELPTGHLISIGSSYMEENVYDRHNQ